MADRFDKFTERARKVLKLAQEEARWLNHNYIGTEHLLLGLIREDQSVAGKALARMGVELNAVRSAVEFVIGRGDRTVNGNVGLTPRARALVELSVDEARRLNHHVIGTEHLLLALVREGGGIAACVLESLDAPLDNVRSRIISALRQSASSEQRRHDGATMATERLDIDVSSPDETLTLLKVLRRRYEEHHHVTIGDEMLEAAVELAALYITNRTLLERAADVIDDAASLARSRAEGAPPDYGEMLRRLKAVHQEKDAAVAAQHFKLADKHQKTVKKLRASIADIEVAWLAEPLPSTLAITRSDVIEAVAVRTGVTADDIAARYPDVGRA